MIRKGGNESAYCRYLRYNVDGWYQLDSKEVCRRWKFGKENNMVEEYDFTNLWNAVDKTLDELHRNKKRDFAEIIENYDFMVGSEELKEHLEKILPDRANIIYSKYLESSTKIFAIKKFDGVEYIAYSPTIKTISKDGEVVISGAEEIVVDGLSPIDTVTFEIYNLKPCICKKCLKLAVDASSDEKIKEE